MNPIQEAIRYKNIGKERPISFGKLALGAFVIVLIFWTVVTLVFA